MFLIRIARRSRQEDSGSALVAVIGVMVIGLILTTLAMSSVVHGLGFTTSTRAGVQSQAAAEAGISAARAGLYPDPVSHANSCAAQPAPGQYVSTSTPVYTAVVEHYDAGPNWLVGCPGENTTQIRVTSTGTAQAQGVAGQTAGNSSKVEAVFAWVKPSVDPSGVGLYLYGGGTVESNSGLDLSEGAGAGAGLLIPNGNLDCSKNNTVINGDVVVHGNLNFTGSCRVNGNAAVTGAATLGSGSIALDLAAASVSPNPPGTHVGGTYTAGGTVPATPPWTEYGYNPGLWIDGLGVPYEVRTLTGADCILNDGNLGGTSLGADRPVVLDALGCASGLVSVPDAATSGVTSGNLTTVRLTSDVIIFANAFRFDVNALHFASSSAALHKIWFITPDYVVDSAPTCPDADPLTTGIQPVAPHYQSNFIAGNNFQISADVSAFLYTPCAFEGINGFTWRGQIYSGTYSALKNNPSFTLVSMGLAGVDLDDALPEAPILYPHLGDVSSIRDLSIP